jgi:rhodanese-related sulfurtransferase
VPGTPGIDVTPHRAAELLRGGAQLVDVREDHEYAAGHVAGSRHVPLGTLSEQATTLDADRPVVFVCRVGGRSSAAAQAFREAGYDARSMAGGMLAWAGLGLPLEPVGGRVAEH